MATTSDTSPSPVPPDDAQEVDVVVVGMGPVGKMMSLFLARAGHSVLVCDRKPTTYHLPRAAAFDAEIARVWQSAGLPPDVMTGAVQPYDGLCPWVDGDGRTLWELDWSGVGPSGWNNFYFYHQPSLESHLDGSLATNPLVRSRREVEARVVAQDDEGVDVELQPVPGAAGGDLQRVRARYVVGADGAGSTTRTSAGIGWEDAGYFFDWLVVDVVPGPGSDPPRTALQVCDPSRPTTLMPGGPGRRRWEFMLMEGEDRDEIARPENVWRLLAPYGVSEADSTLERGAVYTFQSGWARGWQDGRVFLAGDAAHLMPPFAGQGLASGLRDCLNLSWKLDAVVRGAADASLLETYGAERSEHVRGFIDFSMELGRIVCITDPAAAAERDARMLAAMHHGVEPEPPPLPRLGPGLHAGEADPCAGTLSHQGRVATVDHPAPVRYDDLFGPGALVVGDACLLDGVSAEQRRFLGSIGITTTTFAALPDPPEGVRVFDDVDGTYAGWLASMGAGAVLVRPDFYVYGTAADGPSLGRLVDRLTRGLRAG